MKRQFSLLLLLAMAMGVYASDTAQESAKYEKLLLAEWKDSVRHALADAFNAKQMCIGRDTMPLHWSIYGEKPTDGYALFISLHGGGGAPAELNDSQWENQKRLYHPQNADAVDGLWQLDTLQRAAHQSLIAYSCYLVAVYLCRNGECATLACIDGWFVSIGSLTDSSNFRHFIDNIEVYLDAITIFPIELIREEMGKVLPGVVTLEIAQVSPLNPNNALFVKLVVEASCATRKWFRDSPQIEGIYFGSRKGTGT